MNTENVKAKKKLKKSIKNKENTQRFIEFH